MQRKRIATWLVQAIGAVSYGAAALAWLWGIVLLLPVLFELDVIRSMAEKPEASTVWTIPPIQLPSVFTIVIVAMVTIASIGLAIFFALRAPRTIVRQGSGVVHTSAHYIVPKLLAGTPKTKKIRRLMSARVMVLLKLVLACAPLSIIALVTFGNLPVSVEVVWVIALSLSASATAGFTLQWILARLLHVEYTAVW